MLQRHTGKGILLGHISDSVQQVGETRGRGERRREWDSKMSTFSWRQVHLRCWGLLSEVSLLQMCFFLESANCFCSFTVTWTQRDAESGYSRGITLGASKATELLSQDRDISSEWSVPQAGVLKDRNIGIVSFSAPALADGVTQKWKTFANGKKPRGALVKIGVQQGAELAAEHHWVR